jgi:GH15 family glucan-1,4-alpha-glucosidase
VRKSAGTVDGFEGPGEEGTFTIRSFMAGLGAHRDRAGEPRPRALCEKLPIYASQLLLYTQEIELHTGWHLGNLPQVFSHLALINACAHLIREDERIAAA